MAEAAMWFAEIGEVPSTFTDCSEKYPTGKPSAVHKRNWKKYWGSWGGFVKSVTQAHPDLVYKLAPARKEEPKLQDPLEALRASTTEKTYE